MKKKLDDLTELDLINCAIWEIEVSHDGAYVTPTTDETFLTDSNVQEPEAVQLVQTEFITAIGRRFIGYSTPRGQSGIDYTWPTIIHRGERFVVENDDLETLNALSEFLEMPLHELLPMTIRAIPFGDDGKPYVVEVGG